MVLRMGMMPCPECRSEISAQATACPNCGFLINATAAPGAPPADPAELTPGIKGFLMVPALWLPIMALRAVRSYFGTSNEGFVSLIDSSGAMYWMIKIGHYALLGAVAVAIMTFFQKKKVAPIQMIVAMAIEMLVALLIIMEFGREWGQAGQSSMWTASTPIFIGAAVLIPYLLKSRRVKITFVN